MAYGIEAGPEYVNELNAECDINGAVATWFDSHSYDACFSSAHLEKKEVVDKIKTKEKAELASLREKMDALIQGLEEWKRRSIPATKTSNSRARNNQPRSTPVSQCEGSQ